MKRSRKKETLVRPPEFPPTMPAERSEDDTLVSSGRMSERLWVGAQFGQQQAEDLMLEYIQSRQSSFQDCELPMLQCTDSRFEGDDFANVSLDKAYLRRVALVGCRMIGSVITDGDLEDVLFQRCRLDLARQWNTRYVSVRFEHCSLREASFDGSNLAGVTFYKCDLSAADFRNTRLRGADFRGSIIDGIKITSQELTGAIIDPLQAVQLVELLGVVVRPEQPESE